MTSRLVTEFRGYLQAGELAVQKCLTCGKLNMYPRYACPHCQSEELSWQKVSGRGTLHSYSILRMGAPEGFESDLPYALGVVKLEEGVQMLGRLLPEADGNWSGYACDQRVELSAPPVGQPEYRPCAWFRRCG